VSDYSDWYSDDHSLPLEQGDLLDNFDIYQFQVVSGSLMPVRVRSRRVVVMTQSCDIPKAAQATLLLAEVESYETVATTGTDPSRYRSTAFRKSLAEGTAIGFFLLPPFGALNWSLVNFRALHVLPKDYVSEASSGESAVVRLASPYKEHLAQSFARYMMRVGLASTLSGFTDLPRPALP
jgi:hypothetical protein